MGARTLSIVMPNYNHAHFLKRSLLAIVGQSRKPDEVIVVDDASKDDSVAVIGDFVRRFPFIKLVQNERNLGAVMTADRGTSLASGDYIQLSAADDFMLPGFIESLMTLAEEHPGVGIASSALAYHTDAEDVGWGMDGLPERHPNAAILAFECASGFHSPAAFRELLDTTNMSPMASLAPCTIYRLDMVRKLGGWAPDLGMHGVSFVLRALGLEKGMAYVQKPLYSWVWRKGSATDAELKDIEGTLRYCRLNLRRMLEPPFDELFSDTFRRRWAQETEAVLKTPAPPAPATTPRSTPLRNLRRALRLSS